MMTIMIMMIDDSDDDCDGDMMKDSGCPRAMRGIAARVQPPWAQI